MNTKTGKPGDTIKDERVRGLHLRVFPNRQSWYLYYRTRDGRQRRPKLGDHPEMSLEAARRTARLLLEQVAAGRDPKGEWDTGKDDITIAELCDLYMRRHGSKKKTAANDRGSIERHIKPRIGKLRVKEVRIGHVEDLHAAISVRTPTQANRIVALLSKIMNLAETWELRDRNTNPCRGVRKNRETKRRRYMRPDEAKRIAEALTAMENRYPDGIAVLRLLILSGARRNEIAGQKLVLDGNVLLLADSKTGEKAIMLPDAAVDLIRARGLEGKQLPTGWYISHLWAKVRERAGVENLTVHDLRHSFASVALTKANMRLDQIGELLGHSSTQTTKRYAHLQAEAAIAMANATAEHLREFAG